MSVNFSDGLNALGLEKGITTDITSRAKAFSALSREQQKILGIAFAEEVRNYDPPGASLALKTAVTVVIRGSILEDAHTRHLIPDSRIRNITATATLPLSVMLRERHNTDASTLFSRLPGQFPRAWACLSALVTAWQQRGVVRYAQPWLAGPPPLPGAAEITDPAAGRVRGTTVLSGISPLIDRSLTGFMVRGGQLYAPSLSRLNRDPAKLLRILECGLAAGGQILTSNYYLEPGHAEVRLGALLTPDSYNPMASLRDTHGWSGTALTAVHIARSSI